MRNKPPMGRPFRETDRVWPVPSVVIFVRGGAVQWVASNDPTVCILVLDADTLDPDVPTACWRESPIPPSEVDSGLWQIAEQTLGSHWQETRAVAENPACSCGSAEWRIEEHQATAFLGNERRVRPLETIDRHIECAKCGRHPDDQDAIEAAYLAIDPHRPLINAAIDVVQRWESNTLADAVRHMAGVLEEMGYAT